jgi:hypothetical protein
MTQSDLLSQREFDSVKLHNTHINGRAYAVLHEFRNTS